MAGLLSIIERIISGFDVRDSIRGDDMSCCIKAGFDAICCWNAEKLDMSTPAPIAGIPNREAAGAAGDGCAAEDGAGVALVAGDGVAAYAALADGAGAFADLTTCNVFPLLKEIDANVSVSLRILPE
jgi:hypothetical protein